MKKILCILSVMFFSITQIYAQTHKDKKFVETYRGPSYNSSPITHLQNRYYQEVKNSILQNEKKLGKEETNTLLIFNQDEFYRAIRYDNSRFVMGNQQAKTADLVYDSNITSKLDLYKDTVLEKLNSFLTSQ